MRNKQLITTVAIITLFCSATFAADKFRPLFNGKDLTGWVNVNCAPSTFRVRDKMIVCSGKPIGVMRTTKHYENFILELEWRHMKPKGNAGLFVWSDPVTARGVPFTRSIEVQILDGRNTRTYTSHGDVFSIHGATLKPDRPHPTGAMRCLPSERRCKPAGQWNHYRVLCKDGVIKLAVNGKVVSGASLCQPRKGYICLESEGSEVHFRNIKIQTLPSSNPKGKDVARKATGYVSLYNGVSFSGWKHSSGHVAHWKSEDWRLVCDGKGQGKTKDLSSKKSLKNFHLIVDCRFANSGKVQVPVKLRGGLLKTQVTVRKGAWNRFEIWVRGNLADVRQNGKVVAKQVQLANSDATPVTLTHFGKRIEFANVYVRTRP